MAHPSAKNQEVPSGIFIAKRVCGIFNYHHDAAITRELILRSKLDLSATFEQKAEDRANKSKAWLVLTEGNYINNN